MTTPSSKINCVVPLLMHDKLLTVSTEPTVLQDVFDDTSSSTFDFSMLERKIGICL
ncbi:unnamed protein product [Schistosoma margrebowiei]|uniref:Uncharacterized protein n=1 Tax=Schistosoma margrebowiei TaxID=48269 RepID=A0A3P8E965_9TREM|nr:unnamed protein product [Schistosoma margrebowiei]